MHFEVELFFVPAQVCRALKFKTLFFFVPVQVLCTLQLKPSVCFVPVEVWYDSWFGIKMYYFAGYWDFLLKRDVFHCFCWLSDSGFSGKMLLDLGRELHLIKRHLVFKNRVSFLRKLYILEQGLLHHKRTRPMKGNSIQDRKESRKCFFRTTNVS